MIALGIPSTQGGHDLRGTLHDHPQTSQEPYDIRNAPLGKTIWSLLTSVGPSAFNQFCILKVVLLFLNCFCIAVKAASEDKQSGLGVGRPMLKLMDTSAPIFAYSQTTPFVNSYKGEESLINRFVGAGIPFSNSGNHSESFLPGSDRKLKIDFPEGITPSTYLDIHFKKIPKRRFNSHDGQSNNELYLRLSQSSWMKIERRKDCDLCNKYSKRYRGDSLFPVNDKYNKSYNDKNIYLENVNDSTNIERSITIQKSPHENRWVNFPFTLRGNHNVFPNVPSKLFYFPGNRRRRRKRDTRDPLRIQEFNSQPKRRTWNGNLPQEPMLLHRSSSAGRSGNEMTIGSNFRLSSDRKIFRKNIGRNADLNNNSGEETVEFHHLVRNSEFNRPEWSTTDDRQGGGNDEQDRIPQIEGDKSDRANASSFKPRLTADPFSISDTWQRILYARIHRDETWRRIKDPDFSGQRIPQYWFQMSEKQVDDAIRKGGYKIAKADEESWGTAPSATENWGSSETSKRFPRKDGEVEVEEEEVQNRKKELGKETIDVGVLKPDRKGKTVFLWKDKNIHEGQKRSFKKRRQKRKIEMLDVTVVEGGLAALPCDLKVEDPKDSVQLILWIKEGIHTPLYSYDYRELLGGRPREIRPDANSTLSRRTTFRTDRSPAALIVERTDAEDAGIYRCRVDFLLSPTVNRRVNLTVIVPPSELRVSWQLGNSGLMEVHNREAGPFLENSQPSLVCFSDDGWPPPSLSWYEGEELLDSTHSHNPIKGQVENEIALPILTRDDLGRRLTCQASNSDKTHPTTITVNIAMTLSIISVEVVPVGVLWAGEKADVECHVWGSRPSPSIVWWLGPQMIPTTQSIVLDEGNETISVLSFVPTPRDDGNMLICQATNEKLPDQAVQDSIVLSVNYAPVIEVSLGRSLNPDRIKEGDHVYFECTVKSKPPVLTVSWKHNGRPLMSGSSEQVLVSNMSLVVQGVTRDHAGNYTCHATNVRNTSASAPLRLDVKYAPVCASSEKTQYSVAKLENAEIACKVHANPSDVTFKWTFNNTAEAIDVPEGRFVVVKTESRVNYTPMNELDYGTLLCWANNTIGIQEHPCVFHIVAAGKPDPPHNCRVFDVTVSSLQIACSAGDDGGLPQNFSLKVYQIGKLSPIIKVTRLSPSFSISGLRPATAYKIIIIAINDKGSSKMTELKAYTITVSETPEETNAEPARDQSQETRVPVAVAVGIAVALVPVLMMLIGVLVKSRLCGACKRRPRHAPEAEGGEKASHSKDVVSTVSADEINPDIISHTADPPVWESGQEPSISTIIPATDQLPNGGSTAFKSTASTSSSGGAQSSLSRVAEMKQHPPACMGHHHHHFHDTTCLNTSLHAHTCLTSAAAAMPQVPYYTGIQQHQAVEASVPPPESFSLGCVLQPALPTSFNPLVSTLDRKRHHPSTSQLTCPHSENVPLKYMEGGHGQQPHTFFPHLYHQSPAGACSSCGGASKPSPGLQSPLSRMQSSPDQTTGRGAQPHHHSSQCSLSHAPGYPGQVPLPVISGASDVELVRPLGDAKKCCCGGRTNSVVLSPPLSRQIKPEEGRKQERLLKDSTADLCSSTASSSPGHSTRESTV